MNTLAIITDGLAAIVDTTPPPVRPPAGYASPFELEFAETSAPELLDSLGRPGRYCYANNSPVDLVCIFGPITPEMRATSAGERLIRRRTCDIARVDDGVHGGLETPLEEATLLEDGRTWFVDSVARGPVFHRLNLIDEALHERSRPGYRARS